MNTINDMAQLIMACDFDHRHYMEFPQENYPKQILLFKDNSPVNSKISVVLTYSTEFNEFIQINAMLTSEWIAESMVIRSEKDIEKCIRLLDVLDYKHSFTRTITTTITKLIKQDNIVIDNPMATIDYNNHHYIGLPFDVVTQNDQLLTKFKLFIDQTFIYQLRVGTDGWERLDVVITDRFKRTNEIEDITSEQLVAHIQWAEDKIIEFLHSMPAIVDEPFFGEDNTKKK